MTALLADLHVECPSCNACDWEGGLRRCMLAATAGVSRAAPHFADATLFNLMFRTHLGPTETATCVFKPGVLTLVALTEWPTPTGPKRSSGQRPRRARTFTSTMCVPQCDRSSRLVCNAVECFLCFLLVRLSACHTWQALAKWGRRSGTRYHLAISCFVLGNLTSWNCSTCVLAVYFCYRRGQPRWW